MNRTRVSCIAGKFFINWAIREAHGKPRQHIKKQKHHFANKGPYGQNYRFFSVVTYGCESWTRKKAEELMLLNSGVGEDSWEPLGLQGDQTRNPKGNQPWIFIGRTDAEAEAPILWSPDGKSWLTGKDLDAGKDWSWKEKGWGWDGWIASPTQWTWVWANSRKLWRTGKPGVLQSMAWQNIRPDLAMKQQQTPTDLRRSNKPKHDKHKEKHTKAHYKLL